MGDIYGKMVDEAIRTMSQYGDFEWFVLIERAKKHLLDSTNIESSPDEMKVLDRFLFRCWQMGWLESEREGGNGSK